MLTSARCSLPMRAATIASRCSSNPRVVSDAAFVADMSLVAVGPPDRVTQFFDRAPLGGLSGEPTLGRDVLPWPTACGVGATCLKLAASMVGEQPFQLGCFLPV